VKAGNGVKETMDNQGSSKMFKKATTDFKAAILLIVNENVTALRAFFRNLMKSIFKFSPKGRNDGRCDNTKFKARRET
jgi:hypothetical protein